MSLTSTIKAELFHFTFLLWVRVLRGYAKNILLSDFDFLYDRKNGAFVVHRQLGLCDNFCINCSIFIKFYKKVPNHKMELGIDFA